MSTVAELITRQIAAAEAAAAGARFIITPVYNVRGFGAKGDGVTDDAPAIQAAIDAAKNEGGGVIYLPPGTYGIKKTLNLPEAIVVGLVGAGEETTIKALSAMNTMLYKPVGYISGQRIHHLNLDGNRLAESCLLVEDAHRLEIVGVHFMNATKRVVAFTPAAGRMVYECFMHHCKITGLDAALGEDPETRPDYGLYVTGTDNHFSDVVIRNIKNSGVYDQGANNFYHRIHIFGYPQETYASAYGINLENGRAVISNCYLDGISVGGVRLNGGMTTIIGCLFFWRYDVPVPPEAAGVIVENGAFAYTITGNIFRGHGTYTVRHMGKIQGIVIGNASFDVTNTAEHYSWQDTLLKDKLLVRQYDSTRLEARIDLEALPNKYCTINLSTGGYKRWQILKNNAPETGANYGSDFAIGACDDNGNLMFETFRIRRHDGRVMIPTDELEILTSGKGIILRTPDGTKRYRISVDNAGQIVATEVAQSY